MLTSCEYHDGCVVVHSSRKCPLCLAQEELDDTRELLELAREEQ